MRLLRRSANYGQIYDRHLGSGSPAKLERGLNGYGPRRLMYAPPLPVTAKSSE